MGCEKCIFRNPPSFSRFCKHHDTIPISCWELIETTESPAPSGQAESAGSTAPVWGAHVRSGDSEIVIMSPEFNNLHQVVGQREQLIGTNCAEKLLKELANCLP